MFVDESSFLWLPLDVDASIESSSDSKSTSGFVIALKGRATFAILEWNAKRERALSRPTTEDEFVSLSTALF